MGCRYWLGRAIVMKSLSMLRCNNDLKKIQPRSAKSIAQPLG